MNGFEMEDDGECQPDGRMALIEAEKDGMAWNPMTADIHSLEHVLQAHIENGDIPVKAVLRLEPAVVAELLLVMRADLHREREERAEKYEEELKTNALLEEVLKLFPHEDAPPLRLMRSSLLERIRKHLKR